MDISEVINMRPKYSEKFCVCHFILYTEATCLYPAANTCLETEKVAEISGMQNDLEVNISIELKNVFKRNLLRPITLVHLKLKI